MNFNVLVLQFVPLVWGTTFPIIRAASAHLDGVEISPPRFLVAGICMLPFAFKASRAAWRVSRTPTNSRRRGKRCLEKGGKNYSATYHA